MNKKLLTQALIYILFASLGKHVHAKTLTQTEAYLNPTLDNRTSYNDAIDKMIEWYKNVRYKKQGPLKKAWDALENTDKVNVTKRLRKVITQMIEKERDHKDNFFVFYHAQDPKGYFAQLNYKKMTETFDLIKSNLLPRINQSLFTNYPDVTTFMNKNFKANKAFDNDDFLTFILSVSPAIFSNSIHKYSTQTTLDYFIKGMSNTKFDMLKFVLDNLEQYFAIVKSYDTTKHTVLRNKLQKIYDSYIETITGGSLLQIFIHKDTVDDVAYLCFPYGRAFPFALEEQSKVVNFDKNLLNGNSFESGRNKKNSLLLRLFRTNPLAINPFKQSYNNKENILSDYTSNRIKEQDNLDVWFDEYYPILLGSAAINYKNNPENTKSMADKYYENFRHYDFLQARLLLHPQYWINTEKMKVYHYTLKDHEKALEQLEKEITQFLYGLVKTLMDLALKNDLKTEFEDLKKPLFTKLNEIVENKPSDLLASKKNHLHLLCETVGKSSKPLEWLPVIEIFMDQEQLKEKDADGKYPLDYALKNKAFKQWITTNKDTSVLAKKLQNNIDELKLTTESDEKPKSLVEQSLTTLKQTLLLLAKKLAGASN